MNKLEHIGTLSDEGPISKKEAAAVVDLFLIESRHRLQRVIGWKSGETSTPDSNPGLSAI